MTNTNEFLQGLGEALKAIPGATLTIYTLPTPDKLAETIKAHIQELVTVGVIPATVPNFAALHEYVDANVLGDTEELYGQLVTESKTTAEHQKKMDALYAIAHPAMDIVDAWIKAGGIKP